MRHLFLTGFFMIICITSVMQLKAQLNNNGILIIDSTGTIYDQGDFTNMPTASFTNNGLLNVTGVFTNNTDINGSGTLLLSGNFLNNAYINLTGKVTFAGTSTQNISGTGKINNLEMNGFGALAQSNTMQRIINTLLLTHGTLTANGHIILSSTETNTARVLPVTGGAVSGNIGIERYVPASRSWRLMTAPVSNGTTIHDTWQNSASYSAGAGTFITGPGGTNGLDNGIAYSMKTYNTSTQLLEPVNSTNVSISGNSGTADNKGYFIFVRGDRSPNNLTAPNKNITTLTSWGTLQTGTQTFTASAIKNNFTLIGNPYASPVDFNLILKNNIVKRLYVWDPSLNSVGGYVLLDDQDNDGIYSVTPLSAMNNILQSGQAFFVQTANAGATSLTFQENSKVKTVTNAGFRKTNTIQSIRINLYTRNNLNEMAVAEGALAEFNNSYDAAVNIQDATKMININENLAFARDGEILSLERRPLLSANDTLFLKLWNTSQKDYEFEFVPTNISAAIPAYVEDTYLKTSTPVSLTSSTKIDFNISSNTASADPNRFRIVFKQNSQFVNTGSNIEAIEIYPNPVQNGLINLQMNNMPKGIYRVRLLNTLGQTVLTKQINHPEGSSTETFIVNKVKGAYMLEVTKPDNTKQNNKIIIN